MDGEMRICHEEVRVELETNNLFSEGQGDFLPLYAQDFFDYWGDAPHTEDFSFLDF